MKSASSDQDPAEYRRLLVEWFFSNSGNALRAMESDYLSKVIPFRYQQQILQIGSLGWEREYYDTDVRSDFVVVDRVAVADESTGRIVANCGEIPLESESMDVVIVPHCLEFESDQYGVLVEAERILKPEGRLILLLFNPWSRTRFVHYPDGLRGIVPWCGNFVSQHKLRHWLGSMDFDVSLVSYMNFQEALSAARSAVDGLFFFASVSYGVRAVKRRYSVIPLAPERGRVQGLIPANPLLPRSRLDG